MLLVSLKWCIMLGCTGYAAKQGLWVGDGAGWSGSRDFTCLIHEQMRDPGLEAGYGAGRLVSGGLSSLDQHTGCVTGPSLGVEMAQVGVIRMGQHTVWVLERVWAENSPDWNWAQGAGPE